MDYQAYQLQMEAANTAHQREVRDLQAAGLNPILSAHSSGAASPTPVEGGNEAVNKAVSGALKIANTAVRNSAKTAHAAVQAATNSFDGFSGLNQAKPSISPLLDLLTALPLNTVPQSSSEPSSGRRTGLLYDVIDRVYTPFMTRNANTPIRKGSSITYGDIDGVIRAIVDNTYLNDGDLIGLRDNRPVASAAQANHQAEAERRSAGFARASARTRRSNIYRELQEQSQTARALLGRSLVRTSSFGR